MKLSERFRAVGGEGGPCGLFYTPTRIMKGDCEVTARCHLLWNAPTWTQTMDRGPSQAFFCSCDLVLQCQSPLLILTPLLFPHTIASTGLVGVLLESWVEVLGRVSGNLCPPRSVTSCPLPITSLCKPHGPGLPAGASLALLQHPSWT